MGPKQDSDIEKGYFSTQEELDNALLVLSSTDWDATDKELLVSARSNLYLLLSFVQEHHSLQLALAEQLQQQQQQGANGTGAAEAAVDELDSYEALVRDAGW